MLIIQKITKLMSVLILGITVAVAFTPVTHAETPVNGGSVVYLSSKIPSLNPLHSAYEVGLVTSQIFASPVRMDENNEIVRPALLPGLLKTIACNREVGVAKGESSVGKLLGCVF